LRQAVLRGKLEILFQLCMTDRKGNAKAFVCVIIMACYHKHEYKIYRKKSARINMKLD